MQIQALVWKLAGYFFAYPRPTRPNSGARTCVSAAHGIVLLRTVDAANTVASAMAWTGKQPNEHQDTTSPRDELARLRVDNWRIGFIILAVPLGIFWWGMSIRSVVKDGVSDGSLLSTFAVGWSIFVGSQVASERARRKRIRALEHELDGPSV